MKKKDLMRKITHLEELVHGCIRRECKAVELIMNLDVAIANQEAKLAGLEEAVVADLDDAVVQTLHTLESLTNEHMDLMDRVVALERRTR